MKYIYYAAYTVKMFSGGLALFCAGLCLLLNIQFMTGVEIDARLLVGGGLFGLLMYANYELMRYFCRKLVSAIEGDNEES